MKKNIIISLFCLFCAQTFAQQITIKNIESRLITHQGVEFIGDLKDVNNDEYAYSNWGNQGVLFVDSKAYHLSNINFNITTNCFESRVNKNQLFSFKSSNLDSVSLNNHLYKKIRDSFYEVLLEKGNNSLLKKYDITFRPGILNRLDGTVGKSSSFVVFKYLVKFEDKFTLLEFDKKSILSLVNDDFQKTLEKLIDSENLSYRRENDIIKIIELVFKNSDKMI
ncbi:MAG: hypothetical protein CVU08_04090 [Bacteroidetes bacterium HGW-Bacteroidetes-3]|jgi:hypothetical protein|nr:MAG: hypothetical protein CVU08_04090 [Bacteroidetes bacterium HGW-Bacteroidetes-3]